MIKFSYLNDEYWCSHYALCLIGNKLQLLAWGLASPHVTEYATLASALSEKHYDSIEPRGSLTLADAIVITSMQVIKLAAEFVSIVDP